VSRRGAPCRPGLRVRLLQQVSAARAALVGAVLVSSPSAARATLVEDVARLREAWRSSAQVEQLMPRLSSRGDTLPLPLPLWASAPGPKGCVSLAVLASPRVSFVLQVGDGPGLDMRTSEVGWVQLHRCGASRLDLRRALVEMRSPRGILEVLVGEAPAPLAEVSSVLAHRDPGPKSPGGEAGPAPIPPPLEVRALAWEAQARRDGASQIERQLIKPAGAQVPSARLSLAEGCHRLSALGLQPSPQDAPRDLDLFLRGEALYELRREDQSENSDAEISLCVAAPVAVRVGVLGLGPADPAVLQHARFPMPSGLPLHWGPLVRARLAEAFFRRYSLGAPREPVHEALGVAGRTLLPLQLERRTCYTAGLSVFSGTPKALLLEAMPPDRDGAADSTSEAEALIVAFCTGEEAFARLRVEAVGLSVAWLVTVWRIEREEFVEGAP
jgi:hypothetical protein